MLKVEEINTNNLSTVKIGGYNKEDVEQFIEMISDEYEKLMKLYKEQLEVSGSDTFNRYKADSEMLEEQKSRISEITIELREARDAEIEKGKVEAEKIITEANEKAKEILNTANKYAEDLEYTAKATLKGVENKVAEAEAEAHKSAKKILDGAKQEAETLRLESNSEARQLIAAATEESNQVIEVAKSKATEIFELAKVEQLGAKKFHDELVSAMKNVVGIIEGMDWDKKGMELQNDNETKPSTPNEVKSSTDNGVKQVQSPVNMTPVVKEVFDSFEDKSSNKNLLTKSETLLKQLTTN